MKKLSVYILTPGNATSTDEQLFHELFMSSTPYQIRLAEVRGPYPVSHCFLEVVVEGLTWAGQGVIGALAYDLVKALVRGLKTEFCTWTLSIRSGESSELIELNRGDIELASKRLSEALEKLDEAERVRQAEE